MAARRKPGTSSKAKKTTKGRSRKRTATTDRLQRKRRVAEKRHEQLLEFERQLWAEGKGVVAGLDEVGAGPLAGPVVAACVVLDPEQVDALVGVDDSKKLREPERTRLADLIKQHARAWAIASASVEEIDRINILQAALLAMRRALDQVARQLAPLAPLDHLLIDARRLDHEVPQTAIIKGDSRSLSIAAASVLAKVARDQQMVAHGEMYPQYGFERHKGYGTEDHLAAVRRHGVTPLHRRSFEPIATMLTQLSLF